MNNKTNILLITSDQQHYMTLGINNKEINTPNLDRLAAMGKNFNRAYCPNPTCTPTRASIITGMWPSQHGAYTLGTKLMEDVHTVGEDFIDNGYETALVGKAHFQPLTSTDEFTSLESYPLMQDLEYWKNFSEVFYGFKTVELARNHTNEAHVGQHYALWLEEKGCTNWKDYYLSPTGNRTKENMGLCWDIPAKYHYDAWISERSCSLIDSYVKEDKPFFLWSSFFDPHPTYMVPEPYASMYDPAKVTLPKVAENEHDNSPDYFQETQKVNADFSKLRDKASFGLHGISSHVHDDKELRKNIACYYGMVTMMDDHIGIILDKLEEHKLLEKTIIVFSTDHGHFYGQHGLIAKGPFHYEDMIKIPFIVAWKDKIPANTTSENFQSLVDLAPTFLNACGIKVPRNMTGLNQLQSWIDDKEARDWAFCENNHDPKAINVRTLVTKDYKLSIRHDNSYGELYDLINDPNELNNVFSDEKYKDIKIMMYHKFINEIMSIEPLPMPRVSGA